MRHFVPTAPVLAIAKNDGRVQVQPGDVLTYQISFANVGGGVARSVRITETFPASVLTPLDTEPDWSSCGAGCYYFAYPGDLAAGTQWVTFTGQVRSDAPLGYFTNQSTIGSAEAYVATATDTDEDIVVLRPNVTISKSDGLSGIDPGEYLTYTIACVNHDSAAYDLVLTDVLPSGVRYVGYGWQRVDDTTYTRTLRLDLNQTATLLLFAQVDPGATGSLVNTVTMDGGAYVSFPGGNQAVDVTEIDSRRDLIVYQNRSGRWCGAGTAYYLHDRVYEPGNLAIDNVRITRHAARTSHDGPCHELLRCRLDGRGRFAVCGAD